ncbi:serpentine type 7TM GPCR chemoreceptor str domain-containing protein [Ditylenchus destructor]|uniref:Serpentine type 7TM GPCR chemoreceptor str domain-containing protein n=1 Tax=Ditylenchus destructor TaxID=166010 RepID=A0AAD4QXQ7_9BILA|nr:serpentine type 7TM GPCR chemoreceptor str domain-containing protein [Ditylenchus destructor]
MFLFRYCHTADHQVYTRITSAGRVSLLITSVVTLLVGCVACVSLHLITTHPTSFLESMKYVDPPLYERLRLQSFIALTPVEDAPSAYLVIELGATIMLIIAALLIVFCTLGCYRHLLKSRNFISPQTRSLYFALINSLVLDMAMGGLLLTLPILAIVTLFMNNSKWTSVYITGVLTTGSLYPLMSNLNSLLVVRPYRRAILALFANVFMGNSVQQEEITANAFVVSQKANLAVSRAHVSAVTARR